ncbi:MAG TPA: hypothetical protein PLO15_07265 [Propionicimonas sp.]|nr:hypothetical protein [Propionicimonas sp.]
MVELVETRPGDLDKLDQPGGDLDGLDRPGGGDLDKLDQPGAVISKGLIGRWGSDLDGLDQRLAVLGTREGPPPCGDGPSSDWK